MSLVLITCVNQERGITCLNFIDVVEWVLFALRHVIVSLAVSCLFDVQHAMQSKRPLGNGNAAGLEH